MAARPVHRAIQHLRTVRRLVASGRRERADRQLAFTLSFVAGGLNAGAFLLVRQYTSHMTGIVSALADNLASGALRLAALCIAALASFIAGAAISAISINWSRRRGSRAPYAAPLLFEACLLVLFGALGAFVSPSPRAVTAAIPFLCFLMGLQNATITKVSGSRMRTTHMTGIVTDIGIELGKLLYWNRMPSHVVVLADRKKLDLLSKLLFCFITGGIVGAWTFALLGTAAALPVATLLAAVATAPALEAQLVLREAKRRRCRRLDPRPP